MDVTNDVSVKEAMSTILAEAGNIDILINNAGIMNLGITEAFSVEQAKFQMETNYFGAIRVMQAVLPSMRKAGSGLIINTSSLVGRMSPPFLVLTPQPNTLWKVIHKHCVTKFHLLALILSWLNLDLLVQDYWHLVKLLHIMKF